MPDQPTPEAIAAAIRMPVKIEQEPNLGLCHYYVYGFGHALICTTFNDESGAKAAAIKNALDAHRDPSKVTLSRETVEAVRKALTITRMALDAQKQSEGIAYLSDKVDQALARLEKEIGE